MMISTFTTQSGCRVHLVIHLHLSNSSSTVKHQPELQDAVTTRSEIAVHGMQYRNRAIDGDLVAIRLLPRGQWTAVSSNISAAENSKFMAVNPQVLRFL